MLNKNDPLISAVQEVMKRNQTEREAANLVNEKFGITDRKALPHERQHEWDSAYKTVLTEGVEALDEANFPGAPSVKMPRSMQGNKHTQTYNSLHSKLKSLADSGKIDTPEGKKQASAHIDAIQNLVDKHLPGNPVPSKKTWLGEDSSLAGLAPPYSKTTRKDVLVGRGVLKKHPTQPHKHVLAKEQAVPKVDPHGGDQTKPSEIKKGPDYAPAGTTPDYVKPKTQTVNRAEKTSLPPGTMKEEKADKFARVMREFKKRKLHSGSKKGPVVTDPQQAKAIAASEAGISRKK